MTEKNILDHNEKIILIYGIKNERYKSLIEQANKHNYRVIEILDNQLNCEIENLLSNNISNCIDDKSEKIDIEFLLFVNNVITKCSFLFSTRRVLNFHFKFVWVSMALFAKYSFLRFNSSINL